LSSLVVYMLLPGFRPLPAAHSFPTRRSSDLRHGHVRQQGPRRRGPDDQLALRIARQREGHEDGVGLDCFVAQTNSVFVTFALARDRKSTRLNSSHVEISYAVFCLKKKKKQK